MGIQAEHEATHEIVRRRIRTLLDASHARIAIFDGAGELTLLEGRTHRLVPRRRHLAPENQRLGSTADGRVDRTDQHVIFRRGCNSARTISPCPGALIQNWRAVLISDMCCSISRRRTITHGGPCLPQFHSRAAARA